MKYNKHPNIIGDVMKVKSKMKKSPMAKALESVKGGWNKSNMPKAKPTGGGGYGFSYKDIKK